MADFQYILPGAVGLPQGSNLYLFMESPHYFSEEIGLFLDARDHARSNGMGVVHSIALVYNFTHFPPDLLALFRRLVLVVTPKSERSVFEI
jgi:hypothetical protein